MLPRYYFRVRDGGSLLPDDGASQEFATMEEVGGGNEWKALGSF